MPKILLGEPFSVSLISGNENVWIMAGVSSFSLESFLSRSAERFRRGTLLCFTNFEYRKSLWIRGGYQDFPSKFFLPHSAGSNRSWNPLVFDLFRVSNKFG